ncbi:MAG: PASTA domain-containing protein [Pseudonocardiaceae bacterium]
MTIDPAELTVDPGGEVTTTVTVRNLGTRVEEFRLMPGGPAAPFVSIEPTTLSIYPEDEQPAVARFAPLRGPQSPAGVAAFEIVARSAIHGDVSDIARGQVTVTPFAELSAVLRPETSRGRRPARHRVSVTNGGNTPLNTQLAFRDQNGELTFEPPSGAVTLPPGSTLDYSVRINGPHRWFGRTERHPFSAVLTPAGPQPPITLNGTRQQTAVFPWWIPVAAAILIALILPLFFLFKPGTPTVPQVGDFTQSAAEKELRDAGYVVSGATPISDPRQAGLVVRTDPAAGSALEEQERVQVFVSTGPCNPVCNVTVPATKGRTEADARAVLGAAGFTVGQVVPGPSDLPAGSVKETSPAEQTQAPTNVAVVMFTSSGASLKLPPDQLASFQGQSPANVKKALGGSFRVEQVLERSNEFAAGKVLRAVQDASDPRRMTLFVAAPTATDLVALASRASWQSSAGPLRFPGRVTDARGAVLARNKVLVMVPPQTGNGSVTGVFTLSANQKIISGDRLKANIGMQTGGMQFAIKIGGQVLPVAITAAPGQLVPVDEPLDAFVGANTIEISVTGSPSAPAPPAPGGATTAPAAPPTTTANQAVWQNLRIEGTVKNP